MSLQKCPNCGKNQFLWSIDDEDKDTNWYCYKCDYFATEAESLEQICPCCKTISKSQLKDEKHKYWYCFNCYKKEIINEI